MSDMTHQQIGAYIFLSLLTFAFVVGILYLINKLIYNLFYIPPEDYTLLHRQV